MADTVTTVEYDNTTDTDHAFDHTCETLTEMLNALDADDNTYTSRGQNVGWRNHSGTTTVTLTDGLDLVRKLVPDGEFTLSATLDDAEETLSITLSHHDSPTGETHTITPT